MSKLEAECSKCLRIAPMNHINIVTGLCGHCGKTKLPKNFDQAVQSVVEQMKKWKRKNE